MSTLMAMIAGMLATQGPELELGHPVLLLDVLVPFDFVGANNVPNLVLYDNGVVIYQIEQSPPPIDETQATYPHFRAAKLDPATYANLMGLATLESFLTLAPYYDLDPNVTDLSVNVIRVWAGHSEKEVTVRGVGTRGPAPFAALFARLNGFYYPGAWPWLPDSVEVELTRISRPCVPSDPVPWPAVLPIPQLPPDSAVVRYMAPVRELQAIEALRHAHRGWDCTPVAIGTSFWWISYRYPFPGDSAWYQP